MKNEYPVKLISLISGGIDSPVATHLMLSQGADVVCLYLDNRPFTDVKTRSKVLNLVKQLENVNKRKIKLYIIPHGPNQKLLARNCNRHVGCILCRRMMLRLGIEVANRESASGLVLGDSMGQVASQTLQNLFVESQSIDLPILRPLIGLDKLEIESIAKKIGTYDVSIGPGLCCTIVPDKPSTNATLERIIKEEEKLDIKGMIDGAITQAEII